MVLKGIRLINMDFPEGLQARSWDQKDLDVMQTHIRNVLSGKLLFPGSTIKGALRTILYYDGCGKTVQIQTFPQQNPATQGITDEPTGKFEDAHLRHLPGFGMGNLNRPGDRSAKYMEGAGCIPAEASLMTEWAFEPGSSQL